MPALLASLPTVVAAAACAPSAPTPAPPPAASAPALSPDRLLSPASATPVSPETELSASAIDEEIGLLRQALERGYAGRGHVPAASWQAMQDRLEALRRSGPLRVEAFCERLGEALWALPDAHLSARRVTAEQKRQRCGTSFRAARRAPSVGANLMADEPGKPWGAEVVAVGQATFLVLSIKQLPFHEDPAWAELPGLLARLHPFDGVLVDLRGNDGGDDTRGFEVARALMDGPVGTGALRLHERRSPEALTLVLNLYERRGRRPDGTFDPALEPRRREAAAQREASLRAPGDEWLVREKEPRAQQPGPDGFRGPIAVLVDAACASSCESTVRALQGHPEARVFGERTAGYVQFGDAGELRLPHSGVEVAIPTRFHEYPDGASYDRVGFEPDAAVAPGQDAFASGMDWLLTRAPRSRIEPPRDWVLAAATRAAEEKRLRGLGLTLPEGGLLLEKPFAQPLTRRSFVVPQSWLSRRPPHRVYAPALLADLDALQDAMARAYGGWQVAEKHGWDWARWFDGWRQRLRTRGTAWLPLREAFDEVRLLQEAQLDNHTTIPLSVRFGSGSRSWRLDAPPAGPCTAIKLEDGREVAIGRDPALAVKQARRFDGTSAAKAAYLARPASLGTVTAVQCQGAWIGVKPVATPGPTSAELSTLTGQGTDRPTLRHLNEQVAYLRLPTFSKANGEIVRKEMGSWEKPTGRETALVIDLRSNDGGDAAFNALAGWISFDALKEAVAFTKRQGDSCLYPALRWGYGMMSSTGLTSLTPELRGGLQSGLDDLLKPSPPACPASFVSLSARRHYTTRTAPTRPRPGSPRLVLLVNGGCGSDCEIMVYALRKLPGTVVAGANTYGVAQYIQPGYSALPNTQLPFRVALGTSDLYGDDRSVDGHGLDVDVLLDGPESTSRDALLRLAALSW